jgi:NAD-dependent SIR2 family protein deacetylase
MGRQIHLNLAHKVSKQPWDSETALQRALDERARFLEKYPQYRSFQQEIDRMLEKAGSVENRLSVIALLIEAKLVELHSQLKTLNHILREAAQA